MLREVLPLGAAHGRTATVRNGVRQLVDATTRSRVTEIPQNLYVHLDNRQEGPMPGSPVRLTAAEIARFAGVTRATVSNWRQ